jgi:ATP-dependent DNA ligase
VTPPPVSLADDGHTAWAIVKQRGLEGLVANDPESSYRGGPSRSWLKVKLRREGAFLIAGVAGSLDDVRGFVLARRRGRGLVHVGTVEYGFTRSHVAELVRRRYA